MPATDPRQDSHVAAACAALRPYRWRGFTPELLARSVLAARDRQSLWDLLLGMPGAAVGRWEAVQLPDASDARLVPLVRFLESHRWTQLTLRSVCARLLSLVESQAP